MMLRVFEMHSKSTFVKFNYDGNSNNDSNSFHDDDDDDDDDNVRSSNWFDLLSRPSKPLPTFQS